MSCSVSARLEPHRTNEIIYSTRIPEMAFCSAERFRIKLAKVQGIGHVQWRIMIRFCNTTHVVRAIEFLMLVQFGTVFATDTGPEPEDGMRLVPIANDPSTLV
ncbi:hypothetical protein ALC62_09832 [Cyphomyrmex costatus]|uniref:Uncharacterized protein n=1 Tax=Cyphomyrmex costatus TaxID=456900 RepID=A0A195CFJ3_9HYME|nr:hypothetical protein ALC62_09832 [Cyphomyrmex costatus]